MREGLSREGSVADRRPGPLRVLFLCSRNRRRSPTAEQVFADDPEVETASAGIAPDADEVVDTEHIDWADLIVVMEPAHKRRLLRAIPTAGRKPIVTLDIRDQYDLMEPALVKLLRARVTPLLWRRTKRQASSVHGEA